MLRAAFQARSIHASTPSRLKGGGIALGVTRQNPRPPKSSCGCGGKIQSKGLRFGERAHRVRTTMPSPTETYGTRAAIESCVTILDVLLVTSLPKRSNNKCRDCRERSGHADTAHRQRNHSAFLTSAHGGAVSLQICAEHPSTPSRLESGGTALRVTAAFVRHGFHTHLASASESFSILHVARNHLLAAESAQRCMAMIRSPM